MKPLKQRKSPFRDRNRWLEYPAFLGLIGIWVLLVFSTVNDNPIQALKQLLSEPTAELLSKLK